jgi:hypothetical protein
MQDGMRRQFRLGSRRAGDWSFAVGPPFNRDWPKGFLGDRVNLLMAAIVFNFRKLMRAVILSPQGIKRIIVWMMKPDTQRHEGSCVWLLQGRLPASTSKDRQVRY